MYIFQCFDYVSCDCGPNKGYIGIYDKLQSLYNKCAKLILAVNLNVSSYVVLVRLGWLPLRYVLAIQGMNWMYRMQKIPLAEVFKLYQKLKFSSRFDQQWGDTLYYKSCSDMIERLQNLYNITHGEKIVFMEAKNASDFINLVKEASFLEFNEFWGLHKKGRYTYDILPSIGNEAIMLVDWNLNRNVEKKYYNLSFRQNFLNDWQLYIKKRDNSLCRFCDNHVESIDHVLGNCTQLNYEKLRMSCVRHNLQFNVINLLLNNKLKLDMELFILKNFK